MSVRKVLPPEEEIRATLLANGISEEQLEQLLAVKTKIPFFAANIPLALSVIANEKGIALKTTTGSFSATPEETIGEGKWLPMGDLATTDKKLVDMRGYFLGAFYFKKLDNGNMMCLSKWADETGSLVIAVFGDSQVEVFQEGEVKMCEPYLIQNLQVKEFRGAPSVAIQDNVNIRELDVKNNEYDLKPLAEVQVDKIIEMQDQQYYMIKGIITKITQTPVYTCPDFHNLKSKAEGEWVKCDKDPCNGETVQSELHYRYNLFVADETGSTIVTVFPNVEFDPKMFPLNSGIIVNGKYGSQYNNISGNTLIPYNPYEGYSDVEVQTKVADLQVAAAKTPDSPKPETKKEIVPADISVLDFTCDTDVEMPDENKIVAGADLFTDVFYMYGWVTPASLQKDLIDKCGLVKMKPILEKLAADGIIEIDPSTKKFKKL